MQPGPKNIILFVVIPAKAGIHRHKHRTPAFAGATSFGKNPNPFNTPTTLHRLKTDKRTDKNFRRNGSCLRAKYDEQTEQNFFCSHSIPFVVIPAKAGIQSRKHRTPAFAGVTSFGKNPNPFNTSTTLHRLKTDKRTDKK